MWSLIRLTRWCLHLQGHSRVTSILLVMRSEVSGGNPQVICLLDVLGFEAILSERGLDRLRDEYEKLVSYVQEQSGDGRLAVVPLPDGTVAACFMSLESAYFSDTVLFWTHYDPPRLQTFIPLMADAICFSIELGLPLRGAIAVGELILDKASGTFLGGPLVEAARTEREQEWIGISFGPSFQVPPRNEGFDVTTILPYKSHYKSALSPYVTGMAIDWPRKWRESRAGNVRPLIHALDNDIVYSSYYQKTLSFVDFSETNHDWWNRQQHLPPG
jgi:hypothetical protein